MLFADKNSSGGKPSFYGLAYVVTIIILTVTIASAGLAHTTECIIMLILPSLVIAAPITYVLFLGNFSSSQDTTSPQTSPEQIVITSSPPSFSKAKLKACLALGGIVMAIIVLANKNLDDSVPTEMTLDVKGKYISHGRRGGTHYNYSIASPASSPVPFEFSNTEKLTTSYDMYQRIVPGRSQVVIELHKGSLGMPWYTVKQITW